MQKTRCQRLTKPLFMHHPSFHVANQDLERINMSTSNKPRSPEPSDTAQWGQRTSTLESFLWEEAPSVDKNLVLSLAKGDFIAAGQNVIFSGPTACGKSHLANALADLALQAGHSVNLVDSARLDARFSWQSCLESYLIDCDLLVVDDPFPTEQLRQILAISAAVRPCLSANVPPPHSWPHCTHRTLASNRYARPGTSRSLSNSQRTTTAPSCAAVAKVPMK